MGQTMLSQYSPTVLEPSSLRSEPIPSDLHRLTNIQEGAFDEKSIKREESNAAGMFYRAG